MVVLGVELHPVLLINLVGKLAAVGAWCVTGHLGLAAVCFFGPDALVLYHMMVPSAQGLGQVFTRFETEARELWLTIDDGPDPIDTPRILDLLDRHQARATFFVIGARAARHPELLGEIVRRGHQVGNHTQTHPAGTFWCATPVRVRTEIDAAANVLAAAGVDSAWFRSPAGIKPLSLGAALRSRALDCIGWTIRSGDCLAREPERVAARVMRELRPGAIVLVHEGISVRPAVRLRAIELLLHASTRAGYRCILPVRSQLR